MSTVDLRTTSADEPILADVCIVGSGPAGAALARELSGSARVVVLESGGTTPSEADDLNRIHSIGAPRVLDQRLVRNRVVGGSSSTWWGRAATFDAIDFEERPWVPHSGWPITRDEVAPYFARAAALLDIGVDDNLAIPEVRRPRGGDFDPRLLDEYRWTYSRAAVDRKQPLRFDSSAFDLPDVALFVHATATAIDTDASGHHVTGLEVRTRDGDVRRIQASRVVLAGGGIENARLLLASDRVVAGGVGNARDQVGRYLMDHLRGPIGTFRRSDFIRLQRALGTYRVRTTTGPVRVVPGIALSAGVQRSEHLLQAACWVEGEVAEEDALLAARALMRDPRPRHAVALLRNSPLAAESLIRSKLLGRSSLRLRSTMQLHCIVEQPPDPESRVLLGEDRDAYGVPISVIDWRIGEQEARTVRRAAAVLVSELRRLDLPLPDLDPMIVDERAPFLLPDVAHPTGTTRMSDSPEHGVVDVDCRVHGTDNLYVAGSSVFPTSGHANPTQMLVALAIRLADHLRALV